MSAFTVVLSKTSDPINKVVKSVKNTKSYSGVRFVESEALDVLHPKIILEVGDDFTGLMKYNYCHISLLKRYYFISDIRSDSGLAILYLDVDALMSHSKDILASSQYVLRQQNKQTKNLEDELLPIESSIKPVTKNFGVAVDNKACGRLILETTGKGGKIIS